MYRKFLVNAFFVAAIALAVFLFFAVPLTAANVRQMYNPSETATLFVTEEGQTLQMQKRSVRNDGVFSVEWLDSGRLARRHLLKTDSTGIDLLSYYDGSRTWTMTPGEPILRYSQARSWEWNGTVTVGDNVYSACIQYQIGPLATVAIEGSTVPVTQVLAYGRVGDQLVVKEYVFSREFSLVKEKIVSSIHGQENSSLTQLVTLQ